MVEIIVTDEFVAWYEDLDAEEQEAVARVVDLLEDRGVALGFPVFQRDCGLPSCPT